MDSFKRAARLVGAFFLIAMVSSLVGGIWLETMTSAPDYLTALAAGQSQVVVGVLLELVNCLAVVGIAAALYPVMRRRHEALAMGYVGLRAVEATVLAVAALGPLSLVALSQAHLAAGAADAAYYQTVGTVVIAARAGLTGLLTPVFFGLGAVLLYYFLYQTQLVPRFISVWGFIGVAGIWALNLVQAFGLSISAALVFAVPMILNEIFLGIWLIVRGFDADAVAALPGGTEPVEA